VTGVPGGHRAEPGSPQFPGAIAVSHLRVYDSDAVDGLAGGTPHCHTACTEAYAVIGGQGRVITVGGDGVKETEIEAGSFVWFTPGTIHRLVNDSGTLEIVVLMANAGLPEAGDMVITFPDDVLADPEAYLEAAQLPAAVATTSADDVAVRNRRDLAVEGLTAIIEGGPEALARFHQRAVALVAPSVGEWQRLWETGPLAAAQETGGHLAELLAGSGAHLARSAAHALPPPPDERRYGCCGTLGVIQPASPWSDGTR